MAAAVLVLCIACSSVPKNIPEGLSSQELIQKAQEASDLYRYEAAKAYYLALLQRFSSDPSSVAQGEYEIAFIAYKQDRFQEAKEGFDKLLARYAGPQGKDLPPAYQILSKLVLEKIANLQAGKH
jgi:outer membrane protein assembly factor BamD (BamD/ComL family)